jgi:uncharacterized protein (TIGR02001 family)
MLAWATGAIALSLTGMAFSARAEDRQIGYALTLSGNSDYMFRGISYSDQKPIVTAYGEASYGIAYVGLFTSMIDYGPIGPWEQDVYLGIRPVTGPINWDISANWYLYGNRDEGELGSIFDTDYFEFKIGATSAVTTNLTVGGNVWLTPDQGYGATENISVEGTLAYNLPKLGVFSPTVGGLLGYSDSGTNEYYTTGYWLGHQSYTYWNAGVKLAVDKFFMDFRYWDTTIDDDLADSRFLFSAGVNLLP